MATYLLLLIMLVVGDLKVAFGFNPRKLIDLSSSSGVHWSSAGATWYGAPDGAGSDGGSCGYGSTVSQAPFASRVTSVGPSLYNSGKECGSCYQVRCTKNKYCSKKPVRVVITDSCPGCVSESAHFDLSGTSFGAMAIPGHENDLRDAGMLQVRYSRVACEYPGKTIVFRVDPGSNPSYFAVVIEYEDGSGNLAGVGLKQAAGEPEGWKEMQQSWGAIWKLDAGEELQPPFSIKLTSQYTNETLVASNVIPDGWKPGAIYRSLVNFD